MTQEQKNKFIELAKLTEGKKCPEGYVYVGWGPVDSFFKTGSNDFCRGRYKRNNWEFKSMGKLSVKEYSIKKDHWEAVIGESFSQLSSGSSKEDLPPNWYVKTYSEDIAVALQKALFKNGYSWSEGNKRGKFGIWENSPILLSDKHKFLFRQEHDNQDSLIKYGYKLITIDQLLSFLEENEVLEIEDIFDEPIKMSKDGLEHPECKVTWEEWDEISKFLNQKFDWSDPRFTERRFINVYSKMFSESIQSQLFKLGFKWESEGKCFCNQGAKILVLNTNKLIGFSDIKQYWGKEIEAKELFEEPSEKIENGPQFGRERYKLTASKNIVKFGCKEISWQKWKELRLMVEELRKNP